jgi:hypothetical protein
VRALAILLVVACGPRAQPRPGGGIADDDAAITAFQLAWARDVRPKIADPMVRRIDSRMQTTTAMGRYHAEEHECREGIARIHELETLIQNLDPPEPSILVHGNPDALLNRDRCWSVLFMGGSPRLDAEGWLDRRGRLLVAWRIPGA